MDKTGNYQLCLWDAEDRILMGDFNEDNKTLDAALHAEKEARESAVSALNAAVEKCGNCKIWTASYKGTGKYGESNPNSLTFPWTPELVLIVNATGRFIHLVQGCSSAMMPWNGAELMSNITWSNNTVSWYCTTNAVAQMNDAILHYVIAFGKA